MKGNEQMSKIERDYSLIGKEAKEAVANGLADATWYTCDVSKEDMRELLVRKDWPGIRDAIIWFGVIIAFAVLFIYLWNQNSWWAVLPYFIYCTLYSSSSDSRWHETSHGTAFKTPWLNDVMYEIASFMDFRQSTLWRWSHARHHSDTIIRGRDPEIIVTRPPEIFKVATGYLPNEFRKMFLHASGKMDAEAATFVPESEFNRVYWVARIYLAIYATIIASSIYFWTPIPIMLFLLPPLFGTWLVIIYALTQHVGLQENVLDHRLNSRTIYMNRLNRFLYWNMNYHIEHHMFPMVPYHALPKLHELIKDDCPPPYQGLVEAYKEMVPAIKKQKIDPSFSIIRKLPAPKQSKQSAQRIYHANSTQALSNGWIAVCDKTELHLGDVIRFDYHQKTFAIYRTEKDEFYATDGICTHGNAHLADGLVLGHEIECPKHNGRFNIVDGSPKRQPVCARINTYPVKVDNGMIYMDVSQLESEEQKGYEYTVVSNHNVATFIKELVLAPKNNHKLSYQAGEYIQLQVPAGSWQIKPEHIDAAYQEEYQASAVLDKVISSDIGFSRNYSLATNPATDEYLKFNVRIAMPPIGQDCLPGLGSSYVFQLKAGDTVRVKGPFGDFHIKDSNAEMIYIGGGAGMAPLRSHIAHLLETENSSRKISFWYGARSMKDVFYAEYFSELAKKHTNFSFHLAISGDSQSWQGLKGFIHEVVEREYLVQHNNPLGVEYYLCGPPLMIEAVKVMLKKYHIADSQIAFDEF